MANPPTPSGTWSWKRRYAYDAAQIQAFKDHNFGHPPEPESQSAPSGSRSAPGPSFSQYETGSSHSHSDSHSHSHSHAAPEPSYSQSQRPRGRPSNKALNTPHVNIPYIPPAADESVYVDRSGVMETIVYAPPAKRRRLAFEEDDLGSIPSADIGPYADFEPSVDTELAYDGGTMEDLHDDGAAGDLLGADGEVNDVVEADSLKRKRYTSSDDPMKEWRVHEDIMQEEALRRHGLGDYVYVPKCCSCLKLASDDVQLYRCRSCGDFVECLECCLSTHARRPCHLVDEWDDCWEPTSLTQMGLVYQIGHHGSPCPAPDPKPGLMTVMQYPGVFTVAFQYCGCSRNRGIENWQQLFRNGWYPATHKSPQTCATIDTLDFYRDLKVTSNVSVRDFVTALESTTDPYGTEWTPDRYKAFGRMSRQWAYMQRVRRSGVAHEQGGVAKAAWGSVAVECWACPRVGVNLPENYEDIAPKDGYIYRRTVSVDANFKMKCKMRPSPREDPPLYSGLGVQVPWEMYHAWLRTYITEEEMSSCIAFAALMHKETKFSTGLRWTGVLGVICARHEIMLSLGDLEKGERYKNTDWILHWLLCRLGLKQIGITYDIACQYKKYFHQRAQALPDVLKNLELPEITWGLPVWHGNVHEPTCETENSMRYQEGGAKIDGEGIERYWALLNPISYMTREEQPGARHDDHEEKINYINYRKNIDLGKTLLRRLRIATEERETQVACFTQMNTQLTPAHRQEWMSMVKTWLADRTQPNPYLPSAKATLSEQKVREELREQEKQDAEALEKDAEDFDDEQEPAENESHEHAEGARPKRRRTKATRRKRKPTKGAPRMTDTAFIIMGLQLEDTKLRLTRDRNASTNLTLAKEAKIHQRSSALAGRLKSFRRYQEIKMPGAVTLIQAHQEALLGPRLPEDTTLFLPSEALVEGDRVRGMCADGLYDIEIALRKGRCSDAIMRLRARLMARRHFINFRNGHVVGQNGSTRAARLIQTLGSRVEEAARMYSLNRERLLALMEADEVESAGFNELTTGDIDLIHMEESDAAASKKLGRVGGKESRITATAKTAPSQSRATVSWIWSFGGGPDAKDGKYMHDCVRVEWAKALARKWRWSEEVQILREEMRRVLRSLAYEETEWTRRAEMENALLGPAERQGRAAYARKQARARGRISTTFKERWLSDTPSRGQKSGPVDAAVLEDVQRLLAEG